MVPRKTDAFALLNFFLFEQSPRPPMPSRELPHAYSLPKSLLRSPTLDHPKRECGTGGKVRPVATELS
jgi:hypothetical protein